MGICISYQGSLSDTKTFDAAVLEIRGFCHRARWECEDFSEHYSGVTLATQAQADRDPGTEENEDEREPWPELPKGQRGGLRVRVSKLHPPGLIEETVRGVIVMPPDTEDVRLVFDPRGRLVRYVEMPATLVINAIPDTIHYVAFPHFVKTSGVPASHAAICLLLHTLKQKFMDNLQVNDDTNFWQTGNIKKLERKHAEMSALVGLFRDSKDVSGLLRSLGVEIPEGKVVQLDPRVGMSAAPKGSKKKTPIN